MKPKRQKARKKSLELNSTSLKEISKVLSKISMRRLKNCMRGMRSAYSRVEIETIELRFSASEHLKLEISDSKTTKIISADSQTLDS